MGSTLPRRRDRWIRALAVLALSGVGLTTLHAQPVSAEPQKNGRPDVTSHDRVAKGGQVAVRDRKPDPATKHTPILATIDWPRAVTVEADLGAPLSGSPLQLSVPATPKSKSAAHAAGGKVKLQVHDRAAAQRVGLDGPLFSLSQSEGQPGRAEIKLNYSSFKHAYGGSYGSRLRLVSLPACALTSPDKPECRQTTAIASANDPAASTLTGEITLNADARSLTASGPMVLAATTGPSGSQGDYRATSLSASATWSAGANTGDFTWSYPMRVPPVPGDLTPDLAVSYSSASVDGKTANTNSQTSWVGEGFQLSPGFIERSYKACQDDGEGTDLEKPGDLCWAYPNATLTWNGKGGDLVQTAPGSDVWKLKDDDGTRIEHLTGTTNGDDNGEHWRITTTDGTQYFFGLNRLPGWNGSGATKSALTVPVFGNNSGEPCNGGGFADSWCQQAYRWNLDYVVDPSGNAMAYYYEVEGNHYGRNLKKADDTPYDRGSWLDHIDYGLRSDAVYTGKPLGRVDFEVAERCIPESGFDCAPDKIDNQPQQWPDVPWDQQCKNADGECEQVFAPAFFTRKRLTKVTTSVLKADGSYRPVDSWALDHSWGEADADKALLLKSIQHTGLATGTPASLPPVTFNHVQLMNRLDKQGDDIPPFVKYRLGTIYDESGGQLDVSYSEPECTLDSLPAPSDNGKRCFPVFWEPGGTANPVRDWFHKYVVTKVIASDRTGLAPDMVTSYAYEGGAAWHFDDDDGLVKEKYKTWGQWRGYGKVTTRTGGGPEVGMKTEQTSLYLRGMNGDRATKDGSDTKTVTVSDGEGGTHTDHESLDGFLLKTTTYDKPGGAVVSKTVNTPWRHQSASRTRPWGTVNAALTGIGSTRTWTALEAGGWRETRVDHAYDTTYGLRTQSDDKGDVATTADDQCVRITYATPNTRDWLINYVSREETVAVACATAPDRSKQVIADVRTYFDNGALGAAPSKGQSTKAEKLATHNGTTATYATVGTTTYDAYGRELTSTDAAGRTSTTAYTPAKGLATSIASTTPSAKAGDAATALTTTTELDAAWSLPTANIDAAGSRTDLTYDGLGRLIGVWLPNNPKSAGLNANTEYSYTIKSGAIVAVGTRSLNNSGGYRPWSYTLMDGLLRPRQTQSPGPNGGRLLTDTLYNERGLVDRSYAAYYATGAPEPSLFKVTDGVESQAAYEYDGLGRVTVEKLLAGNGVGQEKWRTTTSYGGDRVHVDPPSGGTPITTITDARGQVSEKRQYKGDSPTGAYDATTYGYTPAGRVGKVTDGSGNVWTYTYDQRGRLIESSDPDKGVTKTAYDDLDRVTSSTDARGKTVWTGYDDLDRVTQTRDGSATGTLLTEFVYDTLRKGAITSSTRWSTGQAYTSAVTAYDTMGRATQTKVTVPSAEGTLAGSYQFGTSYNLDGTVQSIGYPQAGGMNAENAVYGYDELARPTTLTSNLNTYVTATTYGLTGKVGQYEVGTTAGKRSWFTYSYEFGTQRLANSRVERENQTGVDRSATYRYDPAGNITSIADVSKSGTDTQCFGYDYLRRLTEAWTEGDTDCAAAPASSVIGGIQPYWQSYAYDATGNRTKETQHGVGGAADTVRTYTYPAAGQGQHRLSSVTQTGAAGARTDSFGYDQVGNTTTRKIGATSQTLTWDTEGRLEKVTDGTKTSTYLYDADGNRLIRRDGTTVTLYLPFGMELKKTTVVSGTRYYNLDGQTVAVRVGASAVSFLAPDHQGTGQVAIQGATQIVSLRRTLPFGALRGSTGVWPGDHGFLGTGINDSTGLTHLGAREYDPLLGRFASVDPVMDLTDPQQIHGYAYAGNNPLTWSDPTGLLTACASSCEAGDTTYTPKPKPKPAAKPSTSTPTSTSSGSRAAGTAAAQQAVATAQTKVEAEKQKIIQTVVALAKIAADEVGLTAGIDCFTTGDLAACGETAVNVLTSVAGGVLGKAAVKYGLPWKWGKAIEIGKKVGSLLVKAKDSFVGWLKAKDELAVAERTLANCLTNSFVPGTAVLMADGSTKPIEKVELGDKVKATDPKTGKTTSRPVVNVITGEGKKNLVQITVDTDGNKGQATGVMIATDGHLFWDESRKGWIEADELTPGAWLRTSRGAWVQVIEIQNWTTQLRVHNLTVAGVHTYYVGAGNQKVLVHNCGAGTGIDLNLKYKPGWDASQRAAADAKVAALNADGNLTVTTVQRAGTSAASRYKKAGNSVSSGEDVDHTKDLQLGGADNVSNMNPLNFSVNRSLGAQIGNQLRGVPVGTHVCRVTIC
ncbi:polymorphic toxin-type HINT domain-containing protein [Nonomuraea sp. NPDC001831]|uniref:polymorphic toxin-type HINT domain-containing protein n=1 Tax=Nonomuraea sp. NPDC001831 TaxID=3364340 RepID=UPI0036C66596